MKFHKIDFKTADWKHLDSYQDRTVFQTREWLQFVSESQNATPVLAELRDGNEVLGYFTGLTFSKFGLKVLGSSFPGWTTHYIGFNLNASISRRAALEALEKFAWDHLKCLHMEISDPHFNFEDAEGLGFKAEFYGSYRTDLTRPEDELFNSMESACRRCVRKAEKSGVKIEEARRGHLRLGRGRQVQGKIWLHSPSRAVVYQVALSGRRSAPQRSPQHV